MELIRRPHRVLPGHRIGNEQNLLRIQQALQHLHLLHQLLIHVQTTGRIHNQRVAAGIDRLTTCLLRQPLHQRGAGGPRPSYRLRTGSP